MEETGYRRHAPRQRLQIGDESEYGAVRHRIKKLRRLQARVGDEVERDGAVGGRCREAVGSETTFAYGPRVRVAHTLYI